jgi:ribosomal protein S18 acetylase RimI-like enzyme
MGVDQPAAIEVRPLAAADADACDQVILSLPYHFGDAAGRRECARAVRTSDGLVAILDRRVVGFLTVQRHFETSAEITWMAVHAAHRGHGAGRALIERLCRELRAEGRQLLLVMTLAASRDEGDVADGYHRTRAFYRSLGFIPAREFPTYWPNSSALLLDLSLGHSSP